jgi:hypothetical protein
LFFRHVADHRYRAESGGSLRIALTAHGQEYQLSRRVRVFCLQRNVSRAEMINGSEGQNGKGQICPAKPEMRA